MFDLNHLRCFVAVAEELHFGRAAARLNMTQPPLSRQIQVLERILDVTLLERNSRSVRLTAAGRSFLPEAQRILRLTDVATAIARRVDSGKTGSLRICFTAASAYSFLPLLITASLMELPDVALSLNEMVTKDQIDALLSGEADMGMIRPPISRPELGSMLVQSERLLVAAPPGHPLAKAGVANLSDLDGAPFVMYSSHEARYFHDLVVSSFAEAGATPNYMQHLVQIHSILALVRAGVGLAIVPESAAALHYEGVQLIPLRMKKPKAVELYLVWKRDQDNPALQHLLDIAATLQSKAPAAV